MGSTDKEWQAEQQRVNQVVGEIGKRMNALQERVSGIKEEIVDIRKNFWEDVRVNSEDLYEMAETYASMRQQAEILTEREVTHRHGYSELKALKRLKQSPYFGRIDFHEEGDPLVEKIYLGIASLLDEKEEHFLVYDWRAPVSSLYYDYPPGPAQYKTPGGVITGEMELKRQFVIRDGVIESMFDTGITIGDELLQEVLGKQSDSQMRSIVATIQKEQNRIIRNEKSQLLIVQGAAGSGKTSAALQRVAYLLYRYRNTLSAEQILLFSPNPMFNSYVSTVLPELGEENMQQTTFQEYLEHWLGQFFTLEDPFSQMEYILSAMEEPGYSPRIEGIKFKASEIFLEMIEKYVAVLREEGMIFKNLKFRGETLVSGEEIKEKFYSYDASLPIPNRMKLIQEWLLQELRKFARLERKKPWVEEEIEFLDKEIYIKAHEKLQKKKRYSEDTFDDFEREQEMLSAIVVQERFKPLRFSVKNMRFINISAIYRNLFTNKNYLSTIVEQEQMPHFWEEICRQTVEKLDRSELAYEDATPYLYLKERIEGFQTNTNIRHVFIDEAQDYSPFQFSFIKGLFPRAKMTILGDINQAIYAHSTEGNSFSCLNSLYGNEQTETIILTRSYRSTQPIIEFTRGLIPGGETIEPFHREGNKPTLTRAEDRQDLHGRILDRIQELQKAGHRTIAILCKTAKESEEAYESLRHHTPLRLVGKDTISFEVGTLVIPSYLAKGVEFDGVIIYNASLEQYGRKSERKLFYTACTRAMHELHLYYIGEICLFLQGSLKRSG